MAANSQLMYSFYLRRVIPKLENVNSNELETIVHALITLKPYIPTRHTYC